MQEDQQININDGIITQECDKSIITIFCSNKEFSIACYQEISNSILTDSMSYSMEDLDNIISKVKLICEPTLFILHPRIISNKSLLDLILCGLDGSPDFYRYKALKSTSWNIDTTRELIKYKLLIRSLVGKRQSKLNPNENYMKIASVIDVECESLTQSLGALVGYMIQNAVQVDEGIVVAATISSLPSHDYLRLDDSSFK